MVINWGMFAELFLTIRKRHGVSQKTLAEMMHCSQNYIWRIEKGQRKPSATFIKLYREMLHVSQKEAALFKVFEYMQLNGIDVMEASERII